MLVEWDPRHLYGKLIPDAAAREHFLTHVATLAWHFQHDAGRPVAETSAELIAAHPEHRELILAWEARWLEMLPHLIPGMAELVGELAAAGIPLYAITNFSDELWKPFVAREAELFAPFRGIVVSGTEKLIKPDPAIYRLARQRFGLAEGEGLFVDDRLENVIAGEAEGFAGHHFIDAPNLRADLVRRGLLSAT